MSTEKKDKDWDWSITAKTQWWGWNWKELTSYYHLFTGLIKREFVLYYKQTFLGPFWMLLQPLLTLFIYLLVFGKLVGIPTGTVPPPLFYLCGIILWNFFSEGFTGTSRIFQENINVISKVYFPRFILPLSVIAVHTLRFFLQFMFLILLITCYWAFDAMPLTFSKWIFTLPAVVFLVGGMGLALGLCFSILTAKYRDLNNLAPTFIRLLMFLTPVIYPVSATPRNMHWLILWNPLTPIFEVFKFSLIGEGAFTVMQLVYSAIFVMIFLLIGMAIFHKHGDKLIDVV